MNVLIVDDSEAIKRIQRYAVLSGFPSAKITFANTAKDALALIDDVRPQLVITDYYLPGMDGFQLLLTLRKNHPDILVGFATADDDPELKQRVKAAGAAFLIAIPFSEAELVAVIAEATAGTHIVA